MKIIFPENILFFKDVPEHGFFESRDGFICQKLASDLFQTLLDKNRKIFHQLCSFLPGEGDKYPIRRKISKLEEYSKTPTFGDVLLNGLFRSNGGNVFQKISDSKAKLICWDDGTAVFDATGNFTPNEPILEIFSIETTATIVFNK